MKPTNDTIIALATPAGVGAIAILRLSGKDAIAITDKFFKSKNLSKQLSHTVHFGNIVNIEGEIIDEVLVSIFKEGKSYTKENTVEISCHGSGFIVKKLMALFLDNGVRLAQPGEFTKRAFLNGRFDLSQAEAVADLIHSDSPSSHQAALNQMRGGVSNEIKTLREKLIHFASLIELELDFSEEDVEFANRKDLVHLIQELLTKIEKLIQSFEYGNAVKKGVPIVIAGKPNAGKSTLLNALLNEEKAIVSDIPGTTRDVIEDQININGITFRFADTAGLRDTTDNIEAIGVKKTIEKMDSADIVLYLFDVNNTSAQELENELEKFPEKHHKILVIANKIDRLKEQHDLKNKFPKADIFISAENKTNLEEIKNLIYERIEKLKAQDSEAVITNVRHLDALKKTKEALQNALSGISQNTSGDLLAADIKNALYQLGLITGEISNNDLLDNIFSKFCIGK